MPTSDPVTTEKELTSLVADYAKWYGWLRYHTFDSRRSAPGFPDEVLVRPPRLIFAELKTEKGRTSTAQKHWLETLRLVTNLEVYVWRPSDWPEIQRILR